MHRNRTTHGGAARGVAALGIAALGIAGLGIAGLATGPATAVGGGDAGGAQTSAAQADWGSGRRWPPSWGNGYGISEGWGQPPGSSGTWSGPQAGSTTYDTLSAPAQRAAEEVTASVVNIDTVLDYGTAQAAGTGIVLSADGLVLTNHHVVEGATEVTGTVVGNGRTYQATVLGYDPSTDVALIRLTGATNLPVATLASTGSLDVGELVVGVGNAGGDGGRPTSVEGVVTALGQTITASDPAAGDAETLDGLIGTTAAIQSGQSGGPLVDSTGSVVGVDVAASSTYGGAQATNGYAIPIDEAVTVARQIESGTPTATVHIGATPFLGVQLAAASQGPTGGFQDRTGFSTGTTGLTIAGVLQGTAAQTLGLTAGDSITAFDGHPVGSARQLTAAIGAHRVGDTVTVTWTDSSGASHRGSVQLGEGPVG